MRSCENEMQFATEVEKDDVSVVFLIVHSLVSLLRCETATLPLPVLAVNYRRLSSAAK